MGTPSREVSETTTFSLVRGSVVFLWVWVWVCVSGVGNAHDGRGLECRTTSRTAKPPQEQEYACIYLPLYAYTHPLALPYLPASLLWLARLVAGEGKIKALLTEAEAASSKSDSTRCILVCCA